jgi:malate dehydrogenase (oxaloacetate-decarboxylating)
MFSARRSSAYKIDQGVGGITISTSKAALYTLGAGINPNRILPVVLDVGTDNHALFSDPLYMGWKRTRLRGKNYDQFIEKFIRKCRELFPNAVIHFEDFGMANAHRFMEKYKDIPMFNDDIQGTGAVALAALIAAIKVSGTSLKDQRIVIYGAGSAGMGIADQIRDGLMILEGLSKEEASKRFYCVDRNGLLVESMGNGLRHAQMSYARNDEEVADWTRANPEQNALRLKDGTCILTTPEIVELIFQLSRLSSLLSLSEQVPTLGLSTRRLSGRWLRTSRGPSS